MSADTYISSGMLELYVAGVLTPAEMHEVERMAAAHESVRKELERIEEAHKQYTLLHPAPQHNDVFDNILSKIEASKLEPQAASTKQKQTTKKQETRTVKLPETNQLRQENVPGSGAGIRILLVASLLLFALSALLNYYLYNQWQGTQNQLAELQQENAQMSQQFNQANQQKQEAFSALSIYGNPDFKKVSLKGTPLDPQASASVLWNRKNNTVYLSSINLPATPEGKQYQLWAIDNIDKPVDAGMITTLNDSALSNMKPISDAKAFAISLEPAGGSAQPTMEAIYAMGNL